ncbi:MAG TPA: FHA domain-containing protein, partial [Acidimicrobiales bacterium]|nr:FHA domain-containing protein [Acidimicrobiales bacterium]
HLVAVLEDRDPEPDVAFAVLGPSEDGWVALLHGQVQVWDGARWISPDPSPGWVRTAVWPRPSFAVTSGGASAPPVQPDSLWDLEAGVVPGQGFVLVPAVPSRAAAEPASPSGGDQADETLLLRSEPPAAAAGLAAGDRVADAGDATGGPSAGLAPPGADLTPRDGVVPAGPQPVRGAPGPDEPEPEPEAEPEPVGPAGAGPVPVPQAAPTGSPAARVLDLRSDGVRRRLVAYPPLPSGTTTGRPVAGAPVVAGVVCSRGHMNRPGMTSCVRCGAPVTGEEDYNVTGTRPALGSLVVDDGSVYRLDSGYLIGSDPVRDPTVRGGLARALVLAGDQVAPSHAEIRLHDWDVVITDRDSPGGTFVYGPDSGAWERLRPFEPRVLQAGTHIALGQRVATFLTPWLAGARPAGSDRDGTGSDPTPV